VQVKLDINRINNILFAIIVEKYALILD